jgi:hypothetical protein
LVQLAVGLGRHFPYQEHRVIGCGDPETVLEEKLTARLAVSDIFYTSTWYGITNVSGFRNQANGGNDSRQVRFNLSYNFGTTPSRNRASVRLA